jgi:hypothetical protein
MTIAARLNDRQLNGHRARRIPHPLDDVLAEVIAAYRAATPREQGALVGELNSVGIGALCTFSERLAAVAVRAESVEPLREGLIGLGMVAALLDDPHDHLYSLAAVNHSANLLGTDLAAVIDSVANELPGAALDQFRAFARRVDRHKSLEAFGLRASGHGDTFRYC